VTEQQPTVIIRRAEYIQLQQRAALYSALYVAMTEGVALHELVTDSRGQTHDYRILEVNPAFETITGLARADVVGRRASVVYGIGTPPYLEQYVQVVQMGTPVDFETTFTPMQKTFRIIAFRIAPGQFATVFCDITAHKQVEQALQESEARYRAVSELTSDFAFALRVEPNGVPVPEWITDAFTRITGLTREEAHDPVKMNRIIHPDDIPRLEQHQAQVLAGTDPGSIEFRILRQGAVRWLRHQFRPVWDAQAGRVVCIYGAAQDITEQKQYQQYMEHLAFSDPLTNLANRRRLVEAGAAALSRAPERTVLLYLDLDRFKAFNDSLGHDLGDRLLIQVARRLQRIIGPAGLLARMGGDEFAVLLTDSDRERAVALATALLDALQQPFELDTLRVHLSGSIGVSLGSGPPAGFSTLLTSADRAMYLAKRTRTGVQVDDPQHAVGGVEQVQIEAEFREALLTGGLTLHYQPIVDMQTGNLFAVEALVRWSHPRYGLLPPARFLPMVEECGLLGALDTWVLQAALTQVARWQAAGQVRTVTVNFGAPAFRRVDLLAQIETLLQETGVPAGQLVIEVTERTTLYDLPAIAQVLNALQELGVRVALDDFGTGYASLTHLRELPVDMLKIERVFAAGIGQQRRDEAVLQAVLALGNGLALPVIVEGVETAAQRAWLGMMGCRHMQGYLLGRPVPAAELDW
jgi:diguanylate cyclase (GGDEF)-like protein/PAS domain S-box-containing protein